jgi:hypothetical protein
MIWRLSLFTDWNPFLLVVGIRYCTSCDLLKFIISQVDDLHQQEGKEIDTLIINWLDGKAKFHSLWIIEWTISYGQPEEIQWDSLLAIRK